MLVYLQFTMYGLIFILPTMTANKFGKDVALNIRLKFKVESLSRTAVRKNWLKERCYSSELNCGNSYKSEIGGFRFSS